MYSFCELQYVLKKNKKITQSWTFNWCSALDGHKFAEMPRTFLVRKKGVQENSNVVVSEEDVDILCVDGAEVSHEDAPLERNETIKPGIFFLH